MSREWMMFLDDMIESAAAAMSFASDISRDAFVPRNIAYEAILRQIEIIGEAAGRVPQDIQHRAPDVPWRDMIALRNRLAHAYFAIDNDVLWNLVMVDLPSTRASLLELREDLLREKKLNG